MRYTLRMALISDRAIVLRRLDYSETSQILALFTREYGQVRVIAKGIKRSTRSRFAVGIDLLEVGQVVCKNVILNSFQNLYIKMLRDPEMNSV